MDRMMLAVGGGLWCVFILLPQPQSTPATMFLTFCAVVLASIVEARICNGEPIEWGRFFKREPEVEFEIEFADAVWDDD